MSVITGPPSRQRKENTGNDYAECVYTSLERYTNKIYNSKERERV